MEEKYYTISLNKKIDKQDKTQVQSLKFLKEKLRVYNSDCLYVQLFSGVIACQDAYYGEALRHMPIIVIVTEEGIYDYYTGFKLDIIGPIELCEELTKEEVESRFNDVKKDNLSFFSYREAVKEFMRIIISYKEYYENLIVNEESFVRTRNNNN